MSWNYLHIMRFWGEGAVTTMMPCITCMEEEKAEVRQNEFELKEFRMLHDDKNQNCDR